VPHSESLGKRYQNHKRHEDAAKAEGLDEKLSVMDIVEIVGDACGIK